MRICSANNYTLERNAAWREAFETCQHPLIFNDIWRRSNKRIHEAVCETEGGLDKGIIQMPLTCLQSPHGRSPAIPALFQIKDSIPTE